ncbi:GNAT family N-acetyltransferase [Anaeromyxobacter oryzae]|uniref:Glycosyl transferase n=1 Tax=Anaeromyxobacter oryzae TaxID=2918170 RepID=A0ABN6N0N8_9BACT|nr:GNAT family N-acetyltransferase [Anaeromyxobacter oryzae]BDG05490.1 glycosyl transferase [Anaeromyxobacter oryzae]
MQVETPAPRPGPRAQLRVEEIASVERLEALRPAWDALWASAPAATPFASPAWLLPWCHHLLEGAPWALAAWRGRELAGLLPTFVYRVGPRRVLGLLGGRVSDYQDVLAEDAPATEALLAFAAGHRDRFDVADLEALPARSLLLRTAPPPGLEAAVRDEDVCPVLALPARVEDLTARASPKLLSDVRYRRRRLAARHGPVELLAADARTLDRIVGDLVRLHTARWGTRGRPGVLADERLVRFLAEAARGLLARGLLRAYALRAAGATLGVLLGFAARGRTYAYLHGIAPDAARHSPGSLLFLHAIEAAIGEGHRELDFLRGREPYKYRWGAEDRPTRRLVLAPRPERARG